MYAINPNFSPLEIRSAMATGKLFSWSVSNNVSFCLNQKKEGRLENECLFIILIFPYHKID